MKVNILFILSGENAFDERMIPRCDVSAENRIRDIPVSHLAVDDDTLASTNRTMFAVMPIFANFAFDKLCSHVEHLTLTVCWPTS